ncbi:uncharacterized protein METZ01_LOCUS249057, partial [marine metagenome]
VVDGKCLKIVEFTPQSTNFAAYELRRSALSVVIGRNQPRFTAGRPPFMFGRRQQPPRPPDREPLLLLLLAVLIAGVLTVSYGAIMAFVERLQSQ